MNRLGQLIREFVDSVTASAVGDYAVTESETRQFDRPSALTVSSTNGGITVRGEDRDDVVVDVTWHGRSQSAIDSARLEATGGDDEPLHLEIDHGNDPGDVGVDLSIAVPEATTVDSLETVNGEITLSDATGPADLSTKNGSIAVERVDGAVDLRALNGEVTVSEAPGIERVETKNGAIEVDLRDLQGDTTIGTATGSIDLALDPSLDADLACETNMGSIDVPVLDRSSSAIGKTTVTGVLGAGGPDLFVEANVGSIEVRSLEADGDRPD
ncbi:MAG: DUF4097 and DUF4098 domain-containing protein YvlB [Halobacteriales archaeon]|jgi:DUF4097 and DUF4098 domain-containing protein YvlB